MYIGKKHGIFIIFHTKITNTCMNKLLINYFGPLVPLPELTLHVFSSRVGDNRHKTLVLSKWVYIHEVLVSLISCVTKTKTAKLEC